MKKSLKSLLVVLAMATAFVCAMAVVSFASEDLYTYGNGEWTARMSTKTEYNGVRHNHATEPWRNHGADYGAYDELTEHEYFAPTCEASGHAAYWYCSGCGYYFSDAWGMTLIGNAEDLEAWLDEGGDGYIAPKGHEMTSWEVVEYPMGYGVAHMRHCENCDYEEFHFTSAKYLPEEYLEEVYHMDGNPADCGNPGYREYYMTECGACFEDEACTIVINDIEAWKAEGGAGYLAPIGDHRWDKGVVQKDGSTLYTCEVCGATKVEPAKGVATGDAENMALWMMLAIAAMVAAGYVASRKEN